MQDLIATDNDDGLGITRIEDLSKQDLAKVQPLVLIELTALFDQQGLTFIRRKARSRFKGIEQFTTPFRRLPEVQKQCIFH